QFHAHLANTAGDVKLLDPELVTESGRLDDQIADAARHVQHERALPGQGDGRAPHTALDHQRADVQPGEVEVCRADADMHVQVERHGVGQIEVKPVIDGTLTVAPEAEAPARVPGRAALPALRDVEFARAVAYFIRDVDGQSPAGAVRTARGKRAARPGPQRECHDAQMNDGAHGLRLAKRLGDLAGDDSILRFRLGCPCHVNPPY